MKKNKSFAWLMAIAIAGMMMTACSLDSYEPENPILIIDPPMESCLYVRGVGTGETRSDVETSDVLFTEDDIEWFDVNTRELRFRDSMEPLNKKIKLYEAVKFNLNDDVLFVADNYVSLIVSRTYNDLVLCYGKIDGEVENNGRYYLYDCYPLQFINDEIVQSNREKRAAQWQLFLDYLEYKGKLKK